MSKSLYITNKIEESDIKFELASMIRKLGYDTRIEYDYKINNYGYSTARFDIVVISKTKEILAVIEVKRTDKADSVFKVGSHNWHIYTSKQTKKYYGILEDYGIPLFVVRTNTYFGLYNKALFVIKNLNIN